MQMVVVSYLLMFCSITCYHQAWSLAPSMTSCPTPRGSPFWFVPFKWSAESIIKRYRKEESRTGGFSCSILQPSWNLDIGTIDPNHVGNSRSPAAGALQRNWWCFSFTPWCASWYWVRGAFSAVIFVCIKGHWNREFCSTLRPKNMIGHQLMFILSAIRNPGLFLLRSSNLSSFSRKKHLFFLWGILSPIKQGEQVFTIVRTYFLYKAICNAVFSLCAWCLLAGIGVLDWNKWHRRTSRAT